jgi:hypothetical protein
LRIFPCADQGEPASSWNFHNSGSGKLLWKYSSFVVRIGGLPPL